MRKDQFEIHAEVEDDHWWFHARRGILIDQIAKYQPNARLVAEIGCGTGGNIRALSSMGYDVIGTDIDPLATKLARERVEGNIYTGDYVETFKAHWDKIDVVILADVLEHVENDRQFLNNLMEYIRPGAIIVLTVPAMPVLWSEHDVVLGHYRRYTAGQLTLLLNELDGVDCIFKSYFNSLLFPAIFLFRLVNRLLPKKQHGSQSDLKQPHALINTILRTIFSWERVWLGKNRTFPVGVSFLVTLKKH